MARLRRRGDCLIPTPGLYRPAFQDAIRFKECFYARSLLNRTYRHLFTAQVIALIGTGLATVALGLLAYPGVVLGTALAIKMIAYAGVAPIAGAVAGLLPRRAFLVLLDLVRAAVALCLPFVAETWFATSAKVSSL